MQQEVKLDPGLEDIESPVLRDFFLMWQALGGVDGLPRRKHFPFTDFAAHISHVSLFEYDSSTGEFDTAFMGADYVAAVGYDYTSLRLEEVPETATMRERFTWSVNTGKPYLLLNSEMKWSPKDFRRFDAISCPLFGENDRAVALIHRLVFSGRPDRR